MKKLNLYTTFSQISGSQPANCIFQIFLPPSLQKCAAKLKSIAYYVQYITLIYYHILSRINSLHCMYNSILRNCMFHFKMFATNFYAEFSKFPCCPAFKSVPLRYNYFVTRYITVIYCHILVYLELRRIIWLSSMYNSSLRN